MSLVRVRPLDAFSEAVLVGGLVVLSGQVALDARAEPFDVQLCEVLTRIDALLAEAGSSRNHLVQALVHVVHAGDVDALNRGWINWLGENGPPARTTVVTELTSPDFLIEITVTAAVVAQSEEP